MRESGQNSNPGRRFLGPASSRTDWHLLHPSPSHTARVPRGSIVNTQTVRTIAFSTKEGECSGTPSTPSPRARCLLWVLPGSNAGCSCLSEGPVTVTSGSNHQTSSSFWGPFHLRPEGWAGGSSQIQRSSLRIRRTPQEWFVFLFFFKNHLCRKGISAKIITISGSTMSL